jgi:hypothetical protein
MTTLPPRELGGDAETTAEQHTAPMKAGPA